MYGYFKYIIIGISIMNIDSILLALLDYTDSDFFSYVHRCTYMYMHVWFTERKSTPKFQFTSKLKLKATSCFCHS